MAAFKSPKKKVLKKFTSPASAPARKTVVHNPKAPVVCLQTQRNDSQSPNMWFDMYDPGGQRIVFKTEEEACDAMYRLVAVGGVLRYRVIRIHEQM